MISKLLISKDPKIQLESVHRLLEDLKVGLSHPDLLWVEPLEGKSLGVEDAKKIRGHFALKPYQSEGRVVVVIGANLLTQDAQNSLLKTLEEPPEKAHFILTAETEDNLLPTILSRCQIVRLVQPIKDEQDLREVEELINSPLEKRFQIIEKTEDKERLLNSLAYYASERLKKDPGYLSFAKKVIKAQEFYKSQGNIRALLEYLILDLPE